MEDDIEDEVLIEEEAPEQEGVEQAADTEGEEEFSIEIEGEEPEDEAPLIKTLRQEVRDAHRELAEYRKVQQPKIVVGPKPTMEDPDIEWDADKLEEKLEAWMERKRAAENQEADATQAAEVRNQEFARKANNYRAKLAVLPVPAAEKEAAEQAVIAALPELYQSAIINYADDPAKVVVALAKHPTRLAQLASETDPVRFILAMKDMERNLKVVNRKRPPEPESGSIIKGSASATGADKQAEKLLAEATRTGNMDKYRQYMRAKKAA